MADDDLRLDGNAAAGLLDEILAVEATTVMVRCAACTGDTAVGAAHVYMHAPGVVLRCPGCSEVLMRFAVIRGRVMADLRGAAMMTVQVDA
jgi:ribosomal protein S27E